jgi:hypothetical protein
MKTTPRNTLLAALLACLAPMAASAAEGYLTPSKNGGSGVLPTGYSKLYFELSDSDWTQKVRLPARPQQGDTVVLSSLSSKYVTLDAGKTVFADQVYLPVEDLSNIVLRWTASSNRWDVVGGESARVVYGRNTDSLIVPESNHLVTQIGLYNTKRAASVTLPAWAPQGAVLAVANSSSADVQVSGADSGSCAASQNCSFVFAADGTWKTRGSHARVAAAAHLPASSARWSDVLLGNPAVDVDMQPEMRLPAQGVEGDIYQITDMYGARFTKVLPDNTDMSAGFYPKQGYRAVFRYDGTRGMWIRQAIK